MVCQSISVMGNNVGLVELFIFPTTCFYHFYSVILFMIFSTLTLILYNTEKEDFVKADMISSLGVSATVTMFLALIGTLIESSNGIVMIQFDIFRYVFAIWIVITGIWFFKKD